MKKKNIVAIVSITAMATIATGLLFAPHTITIKERSSKPIDGVIMKETTHQTTLLNSLKNPYEYKPRKKEHAVLTGMVDGNGKTVDGTFRNVWKDETIYVDYKPESYTATYKADGTNYYTTSFNYGEEPTAPDTKSLVESHPYEDFKEWKADEKTDSGMAETGTDDLSVSYTAVFTGKTYKIEYDLDGGTADNPDSYQYGVGVDSLNNASKNGYTFDGWYSDAEKTNKVTSISKENHDDIKLYAKFHENPKPVVHPSAQNNSYSGRTSSSSGGSTSSGNTASANSYSAPAAQSHPQQSSNSGFPYVGNMGAIRIGNYTAALYSGGDGQAYTDMANTAWTQDVAGDYLGEETGAPNFMAFYDHAYQGTKAAISSGLPLQWLKPDGTVVTLTQKKQVVSNLQWKGVDGVDYMDGRSIQALGGTILFQTCYGNQNLLGIY